VYTLLWISAALGTAILVAIANIIDSHVLSKKMPGLSSFLVPLAVMQFIIAAVFFVAFPFPAGIHLPHLLAAFGAALCNAFSLIITLNCLKQGEVSRVIPVTSSSPIFVALLSMPLLGEVLNYWQWLAVVITVYGAVLVSLHHDGTGEKTRLQKSFFLLLFAALLTAVSSIGYKYALETMTSWNMVSINAIFVVVIVLVISLRKATLLELKHLPQRTRTFGLIACSQTVVYIGVTLSFIAIANGPVALVSTIMNIRPAFVFLFSLLLSLRYPNFLNERLDKRTILYKVFGIVLITGGVAIIGLFN
jgi:uncharacterized membrane protein